MCHDIVSIHDNARPHTAAPTQGVCDSFKCELFDHHTYSHDLAPSDYQLLPDMKKWLESKCFVTRLINDEKLKDSVRGWPNSQAVEFYDESIRKTCSPILQVS